MKNKIKNIAFAYVKSIPGRQAIVDSGALYAMDADFEGVLYSFLCVALETLTEAKILEVKP